MRLFPPDWQRFLEQLIPWGELSISARRTFLDGLRPGISLAAVPGDPALEELKDAGLLTESEAGGSLVVAQEHESFHHVMKALEKYPLFEGSRLAVLCSYLAEHYSPRERSLLHESLALLPNDLPRVAGLVSSVEWLETALPQQGAAGDPAGLNAARTLLAFFREQRDRVAVRDLEEYFRQIALDDLCAGIRTGIQRAVFFLGLRRPDLEPLIGIWPAAARRLRRMAVVLAPEPVKAESRFRHPWLVEDMTTILLAARVEPIPLRRGDEKPFIRFIEGLSPALLSIPGWVEGVADLTLEGRIALSIHALRLNGLLVPDGSPRAGPPGSGPGGPILRRAPAVGPGAAKAARRPGRKGRGSPAAALSRYSRAAGSAAWREPSLVPAPWSSAWIEEPVSLRRERILGMLAIGSGGASGLFDLLEEEWTSSEGAREEILPWLVQAYSSVPVTSFIRFADFAEYQAGIGSPLGAVGSSRQEGAGQGAPPATEEALEELWKSFLGIFFGRCLLSLDGAEAGLTGEGEPCFRLTREGRRILGLPGDGVGDEQEKAEPAVIVQPNFEIVFLVPSPAAEAELGRFCERAGRDVGILFRITKESISRAARSGLGVSQVLGPLRRHARSELPPNVGQEIQGWINAADLDSIPPAP